ncbi:hypothetical protein [Parasitella parasitica]|uniref:Uncharacterized protein n=1 Tax=Parasitella parasitica TaxID=35722 RepID=A0A0B7MR57_9FUNG|nr:hypothetical protein [Parasitella parasitica]
MLPQGPFQDIKKRSGKVKSHNPKKNLPKRNEDLDAPGSSTALSYSTAVSTLVEDFDAILSAMSPGAVENFFSTFKDPVPSLNCNPSAPAPEALQWCSSIGGKKHTFTTDKRIQSPPKDKATDLSVKSRILTYGNASFATSMK